MGRHAVPSFAKRQRLQRRVRADRSTAVSFGTDADGGQWTVDVNVETYEGDQHQIDWSWSSDSAYSAPATDRARITTVVDGNRTYVLAELPRATAPTGQLQITAPEPTRCWFRSTTSTLTSIGRWPRTRSANPPTYTAQIIGPDGAVLANWPSS